MKANIIKAIFYSHFEMVEKYAYFLFVLSVLDELGLISLEKEQIILFSFIGPLYIFFDRIMHCLIYNIILNNGKCVSIKVVNIEELFQFGKLNNATIKVTFMLEGEKWKEFYYYKTKLTWKGDMNCFLGVHNGYMKNDKIIIDETGMPSIYMKYIS